MNVIVIKDLVKIYESNALQVTAVDHVDLTIEDGEFTAIVGPSGSGKTTLLNLIGGLDTPNQGQIIVEEVDITAMNPKQLIDFRLHNIGFVFQSYNLIPVLTAYENVAFIMELQRAPKPAIERRTNDILREVGLGDRMNSRPNQLSGGQQQRVAVARAMASKPKFIIADEPTANLDSKSTEKLLEMMETLNQREQITFLFSTHDQRVMNKAHRIIVLEDGKIVDDYRK
ncbi:MAG: ABC transporter ATP-binding protein [Bacteroidales bacterium]|jgi:putative ABC transport system ATP-binding protein|nr:ABC transporter ATP-binding protein [Bacteroidales bacterium]OPZ97284.1 MAG: ABC transporter ATP-binding protein YtrE [Bacteroidetes bacterium ADurb.Bin416]HBL71784.1 macrolide ABC transporter ATP-binding protein [Bacteroidales bacterium]